MGGSITNSPALTLISFSAPRATAAETHIAVRHTKRSRIALTTCISSYGCPLNSFSSRSVISARTYREIQTAFPEAPAAIRALAGPDALAEQTEQAGSYTAIRIIEDASNKKDP